ncbi:MAG: prolyl oligopeptidase family serine peptidase, partial [Flavobacterium sp.]
TSSDKLAAVGTSAGGITIGRAFTEKPNLFKTAVIRVGALNALRSENSKNTFTVTEFGTSKDSLEFQYLLEMDVYHHLKDGVKYPSVYFTAGLNDHRVAAWEPVKVVAKMQKLDKNNIVLFKVTDQGHFSAGDPATNLGETYAFLFWQLGHPDFKYIKK